MKQSNAAVNNWGPNLKKDVSGSGGFNHIWTLNTEADFRVRASR